MIPTDPPPVPGRHRSTTVLGALAVAVALWLGLAAPATSPVAPAPGTPVVQDAGTGDGADDGTGDGADDGRGRGRR